MTLVIEQLIKFGQEQERVLKETISSPDEGNEKRMLLVFSSKDQVTFNIIFANLILLASSDDDDSKSACSHFISSFKEILISYPPFEKIEMTDAIKKIYEDYCNTSAIDKHQEFMLGISEIKNLLYK